jgi:hypothetical protein
MTAPDEATVPLEPEYRLAVFPRPPRPDDPCRRCRGVGVEPGLLYESVTGEDGVTLLVQVFCEVCEGCGSADAFHTDCRPADHGTVELSDLDGAEDPDDLDEEQDPPCFSCGGRRWWAVQGFPPEGEAGGVVYVRMPCGCSESLCVAGTMAEMRAAAAEVFEQ